MPAYWCMATKATRGFPCGSSARLILAKRTLETATACHLCNGVEGKNQAERDAKLQCLVIEEKTAVEFMEDEQA